MPLLPPRWVFLLKNLNLPFEEHHTFFVNDPEVRRLLAWKSTVQTLLQYWSRLWQEFSVHQHSREDILNKITFNIKSAIYDIVSDLLFFHKQCSALLLDCSFETSGLRQPSCEHYLKTLMADRSVNLLQSNQDNISEVHNYCHSRNCNGMTQAPGRAALHDKATKHPSLFLCRIVKNLLFCSILSFWNTNCLWNVFEWGSQLYCAFIQDLCGLVVSVIGISLPVPAPGLSRSCFRNGSLHKRNALDCLPSPCLDEILSAPHGEGTPSVPKREVQAQLKHHLTCTKAL